MKELSEIELLAQEHYHGLIELPWVKPGLWEYDREKDALILSGNKLEKYLNRGK